MANNVFKIKRTSVSGRAANTSTLTNPGELALNMTDGIMYSTNGSSIFEIGANLTSARITSSLTFDNDRQLRFKTVNTSSYAYFVQQSDDNFVFYTTNGSYSPRAVYSIYANSGTSNLNFGVWTQFGANVTLAGVALYSNGSPGSAGQVLTSNGTATYWSTISAGGGSVNTDAQFIWNNTHTFSANVSFSDDIALNTNNAIYFGGLADANWRMARNSNTLTKWIYTNNTIDIVTANSPYEGFAIGLVSNTTYFETGYLGTYVKDKLVVGNTSSNVTINSTTFTGTANNSNYLGGNTASDLRTYTDNKSSNAYSNAVSYIDTAIGTANSAITGNAATAYTNAVSYVDGKSYVNTSQLSSNLSNYVTTTNLSNNLANYQTTAGLSDNVATLSANSATHLGNSSGTIANVVSWITSNASAAYTNAISYTDTVIGNVNTAITSNASAAYSNAVSYVDGKFFVNTSQLSSNLSNYVTTTNLSNNLANYQTTAGMAANVATLAANSATYLGNSSGTIANVATWITSNASAAYTNAVSYTDSAIGTANSAITGNAATAYTNAVSYTDSKILTANSAITGNAATAYTNAVSYVDGKSYVNTSQLTNNLSNYALLSGATFTGNVVANNANTTYDLNVGRNLTVAGNLTITGNVTVIGANTFSIVDNMFYLNSNNTTQNVDLGFAGNYNDGTYHHAGFFRDATDGVWKVFDNYDPEPDAAVNIDTTNTTFHIANFQANVMYIGNTTVYSTVNTTNFTGTANNTLFVGSVASDNVVSNSQLQANIQYFVNTSQLSSNLSNYVTTTNLTNNLANYQTTAGLSANVATLTANNTNYLGGTAAASYQLNSTLNANIASYLPTYNGVVNASSFTVGSSVTANSTRIVIGSTVGLEANGSLGSANQVLTSNGSAVYWANGGGGSSAYVRGHFVANGVTSFPVSNGYLINNLDVYLNGVKQHTTDVDVSSGANIVFTVAPPNNSIISFVGLNGPVTYVTPNTESQYNWTNTQTFSNTITFTQTINATSNNTLFVGSVDAVNIVSNAQLQANLVNYVTTTNLNNNLANYVTTTNLNNNLANYVTTTNLTNNLSNYQTTAGLAGNVATLTANNTSFVGSVSAANVVSNAQLQANLSSKASTGKAIAMAIVFGG